MHLMLSSPVLMPSHDYLDWLIPVLFSSYLSIPTILSPSSNSECLFSFQSLMRSVLLACTRAFGVGCCSWRQNVMSCPICAMRSMCGASSHPWRTHTQSRLYYGRPKNREATQKRMDISSYMPTLAVAPFEKCFPVSLCPWFIHGSNVTSPSAAWITVHIAWGFWGWGEAVGSALWIWYESLLRTAWVLLAFNRLHLKLLVSSLFIKHYSALLPIY